MCKRGYGLKWNIAVSFDNLQERLHHTDQQCDDGCTVSSPPLQNTRRLRCGEPQDLEMYVKDNLPYLSILLPLSHSLLPTREPHHTACSAAAWHAHHSRRCHARTSACDTRSAPTGGSAARKCGEAIRHGSHQYQNRNVGALHGAECRECASCACRSTVDGGGRNHRGSGH